MDIFLSDLGIGKAFLTIQTKAEDKKDRLVKINSSVLITIKHRMKNQLR